MSEKPLRFEPSVPGPKGARVGPGLHFPILAEGLDLALHYGWFAEPGLVGESLAELRQGQAEFTARVLKLVATDARRVLDVGTLVLERVCAARPLPHAPGWTLRASLMFIPTLVLGAVVPMWVADHFAGHSALHLSALGTVGGALFGLVCSDFVAYWLHRLQHRSLALWRFTHQLHHSAERVDVLGVGFFHPLDIAIGALFTSIVVAVLGLSEGAVALAGLATLFMGVLQHLNVRTPVWLGYLVQRPESHSVHHLRGFHRNNYGNLALWDLVFGTFQNPEYFASEAGFYDGASRRLRDMLLGRDIQR